jgi:hypothetical protein
MFYAYILERTLIDYLFSYLYTSGIYINSNNIKQYKIKSHEKIDDLFHHLILTYKNLV